MTKIIGLVLANLAKNTTIRCHSDARVSRPIAPLDTLASSALVALEVVLAAGVDEALGPEPNPPKIGLGAADAAGALLGAVPNGLGLLAAGAVLVTPKLNLGVEVVCAGAGVVTEAGAADGAAVTPIDAAKFAADLAADPMATEKLATGIEAFAKDLEALRDRIRAAL